MKIFRQMLVAAGLLALATSCAFAYEPGTFILRGGVGTVVPKSENLTGTAEGDFGETFEACVEVGDGTGMLLGGTYLINENWAFDVLAALPIKHDIDFELTGFGIPELDEATSVVGQIGDTKQLPPTFSFQYHFAPDSVFQPYAGPGLNWTTFSSTNYSPKNIVVDGELIPGDLEDDFVDALGISKMHLDDSIGVAAQLGADWAIGDRAVLNFDVRWMDIDSDLSFSGPGFDGKEKAGTLDIDPWIYSLNLGYRF